MNTILNFPQRTSRFQISTSFIIYALFLALTSCQKTSFDQDPLLSSSAAAKKDKVKQDGIKDIDGNVYKTVKIGEQVWMAENLQTSKYQNGDPIATTAPATLDLTNETEPKYQWAYDGNEKNVKTYGRLYTWYAVMDSRNVCPIGWHLPGDAEWATLTAYLGTDAGGKLKETGTTHWISPNIGATNETGFTAVPGGLRSWDGFFLYMTTTARWWSATEAWSGVAKGRTLNSSNAEVYSNLLDEKDGNSVRCIED